MSKTLKQRKPKKNKEILENQPVDSLMESISASMESENADIEERDRKRKRNTRKPRQMNLGFFILMGVPFSWSLVAGLISTTEFQREYLSYLIQVFFVVGILGLIFTYKIAIRTLLVLFAGFVLYTLYGFFRVSEPEGQANDWANLLRSTFQYVIGIESHTMTYERVVVWIIVIGMSLFVVLFAYYRFNFIILFVVSATFFSLLVTSAYFYYLRAFYVYIVCILTLVVRRMHERSSEKTMRKSPYTRLILPITVVCFLLVGFLPMPEEGTMQGPVRNAIMRPLNYINDTFYNLTQRRDFSLRQIGFGGTDGRLGGAVELNHEVTMRIRTDGPLPLYLTGATFDTYTGYAWRNTFFADTPVDFSLFEQNIGILERFNNTDVIHSVLYTTHDFQMTSLFADGEETERIRFDDVLSGDILLEVEAEGDGVIVHQRDQHGNIFGSTRVDGFPERKQEMIWSFTPRYHTLEVDVLHFRPSFVFHSGTLLGITTEDDVTFLRDREGGVRTDNRFQRHSRYEVNYILNNQLPYLTRYPPRNSFYGMLRALAAEVEEGHNKGLMVDDGGYLVITTFDFLLRLNHKGQTHEITARDLLNNYLVPRRDMIYETYTALPEDFPEAVRERAIWVTTGATSNYQMMRMLEEYLSRNYTYTLRPVSPPRDVDFVYHFLFDTREGHCVYFSTAFTTMARSLGMPTRHVEGFLVNGVPNREGYINVLNSMAHAWPEVYFEGWGWHPFEPTPASGIPQLRPIPEEAEPDWNPWMDPELAGEMDEDWEVNPGLLDGMETGGEEGGDLEGAGGSGEESRELGFWGVVGILLLAVTILALIRALWVYWKYIGWRKKGNVGAVLHAFDSVLTYLKLFNYEMKEGETVFRFMGRVCNKTFLTSVDEKKRLERTVEIYGKARYSGQEIDPDERILVERTRKHLENRAKSYLGRPKYYFYRYILGVAS